MPAFQEILDEMMTDPQFQIKDDAMPSELMIDMYFIKYILTNEHHLTSAEAEDAMRVAKIRSFFLTDPDMAGHNSHRQWAEYAYECWKADKMPALLADNQCHL